MNSSMTTIQVSEETAEVLKLIQVEADARQMPLDVYLRVLAERANGREAIYTEGKKPFYETASAEEWIKALQAWVESHKGRNYGFVDDSRESIYREREDRQL